MKKYWKKVEEEFMTEFGDVSLDEVLAFVQANLDPEDVFEADELDDWAAKNEWTRKPDTDS